METQQQPQVPLCVNEWGGETAEVWSGDGLLVRLSMIKNIKYQGLGPIMKNGIKSENVD